MIETAIKEDLILDKKLIIPKNKLDAIRIMNELHPVVGGQPTHEKDQPNDNNPILDLACTLANIHSSGVGEHADLRSIQNESPKYFYGKGFMSGVSSLKGNGILVVFGQWRDASGRYAIKQFYYTDKEISYRNAISDTAWSGWIDVLTGNSSLDYNKLLNVPITSTLSDSKTQIASIFTVNEVNRKAVTAQKTANEADAKAVSAMNEAKTKVEPKDVKTTLLRDGGGYYTTSYDGNIDEWVAGDHGLLAIDIKSIPKDVRDLIGGVGFVHVTTEGIYSSNLGNKYQFVKAYRKPEIVIRVKASDGVWTSALLLSSYNTTVGNHGQLHSGTGASKELVAIEESGVGTSALTRVNTSNFRRGIYYDSPNAMDDAAVSTNNIVIGGHTGSAGGAIYIDRYGNIRIYGRYSSTWSSAVIPFSNKNTSTDPSGFIRSFGNAIALTTDKLTSSLSDSKINPASIFIVNEVNRTAVIAQQSANNANEKANKAQQDASKGINDAAAADKKAIKAQVTADSKRDKTDNTFRNGGYNLLLKPIETDSIGFYLDPQAFTRGLYSSRSNLAQEYYQEIQNKSGVLALLSDVIGVSQKWQDVTSQRAPGTDYVNNTGKGIFVSISISDAPGSPGDGVFIFWVDGIQIINYIYEANGLFGETGGMIFVPAGSTYSLGKEARGILRKWVELK